MACSSNWIEVTSAVGTAGAAIIALGAMVLAFINSLGVKRVRASLVAARLYPRLRHLRYRLALASTRLDFSTDGGRATPVQEAQEFLSIPEMHIPIDELEALAPLPKRCAYRLAKGLSMLEVAREAINRESIELTTDPTVALSEEVARKWSGFIDEAERYVMIAVQECGHAAAVRADEPSGQELYGDVP